MTYILIADIGGTNARFARVDVNGIHDVRVLSVDTKKYKTPIDAAKAYIEMTKAGNPIAGTFAIAGPVKSKEDTSSLTNTPEWVFSRHAFKKAFSVDRFDIVNDFKAMAIGVLCNDLDECFKLGDGEPEENGNIGVVGPGTGLGVASLIWDDRGGYYVPVPGEGGHITLPHKTDREWQIAKQIKADQEYTHVSFERLCSGRHLPIVYKAICKLNNQPIEDLRPEDVSARAVAGACPACVEAVDTMLGLLGCIAGNLALTNSTFGGVYFCGDILPKMGMDFLQKSRLRQEFWSKGRQENNLKPIPTYVVNDKIMALKGLRDYVAPMIKVA
jgi:glucokinase